MPLYEYQCASCGKKTEVIQSFRDAPPEACPHCGGALRKLLSSPAFQFKGSGFYATDYGKPGGKEDESSQKEKVGESPSKETDGGSSSKEKEAGGGAKSEGEAGTKGASGDSSKEKKGTGDSSKEKKESGRSAERESPKAGTSKAPSRKDKEKK